MSRETPGRGIRGRLMRLSRRSRIGIAAAALVATAIVTPATVASAQDAGTDDVSTQAVSHRVPFPCGQTWSGQTRTNHSPLRAVDFNRTNDQGDAVTASAPGTVVHRGSMSGTSYGNLVVIRHSDGTATYYAHLSGFAVSNGQSVNRGQTIGYVGGTGFPNTPGGFGAHLHYEQRTSYGGSAVSIRFNNASVYYYGTRNYTSDCGGGSTNPYTPGEVCGSGYTQINSHAVTGGRIYLMYNSSNQYNCVVTIKSTKIGTASPVSASLEVQGGTKSTDSGNFAYYAGPVKKHAPSTCVKWGGSVGSSSWTSAWSHCG
ncbi:murein DD-endopeptidase MepM/ murein hydrolase activator NlpD [Stackebrandtia albiflava]|uniref:Murein DD-endopeptidase MepM/ murein hydrolase activator NlpD n=1 Tax=Stackebrandtia albiflava TaxID=406432 RepID=A0A562URL3_9ACTN|nr:M23 family metallopeptidase [Stackebrandtia albiflava]TWJ08238.1 murein DD-endopeptidase MepM/ murein hydrolase activator NlpD [Stackebrandtia albiflava]